MTIESIRSIIGDYLDLSEPRHQQMMRKVEDVYPAHQAHVELREAAWSLIKDLDRSLVGSRDIAVIHATNTSVKRLRILLETLGRDTPAPQSKMPGDPKPFMHGIMQPDGTAYMDEICVDIDRDTLDELIEEHEMGGYKVVPLYLHPPAPSRNIDDMRKAAWELVKKNGWDATARLSLHQTTELMAALATTEGQP